ncbi:MAG: hypothetical protein ACKPE6_04930 [Gammaproteobacteria bacterium]
MRLFERASRPAAILPRLVIVVALAALAGYLWFGDPLQADSRRAAQFCESVQPGTPVIRIMQEARGKGATGFSTPWPEELRVAFGKAACTLPLRAGAFAG